MSNYHTNFISQPNDQIVYNTFYFQKLLEISEKQLGIDLPVTQYLSQTVNRNLKAIAEGNYLKFSTKNTFTNVVNTNNIALNFSAYDNCLLSGFEVGVDNISNETITFKVYPGSAIIDTFLIELNEIISFDFDTSIDSTKNRVVIVLDYIGRGKDSFSIRYYLLDENNNVIIKEGVEPWRASYLPLTIFSVERGSSSYILSLESLGVPFVLYTNLPENNKIYDENSSLMYQFAEIEYIETIKNKTILGTKSLIPLFVPPKHHVINGIDYIIPNYGKQVNNGYEIAKLLFIDKSPLATIDTGIPILKPTNNNLYNSMFTADMFSNFLFNCSQSSGIG